MYKSENKSCWSQTLSCSSCPPVMLQWNLNVCERFSVKQTFCDTFGPMWRRFCPRRSVTDTVRQTPASRTFRSPLSVCRCDFEDVGQDTNSEEAVDQRELEDFCSNRTDLFCERLGCFMSCSVQKLRGTQSLSSSCRVGVKLWWSEQHRLESGLCGPPCVCGSVPGAAPVCRSVRNGEGQKETKTTRELTPDECLGFSLESFSFSCLKRSSVCLLLVWKDVPASEITQKLLHLNSRWTPDLSLNPQDLSCGSWDVVRRATRNRSELFVASAFSWKCSTWWRRNSWWRNSTTNVFLPLVWI